MEDLFDNIILCKECNKRMEKIEVSKEGFKLRALKCPKCFKKIIHPADLEEYAKFHNLKNKQFHVKLRMVGNSYAVSIPHEIIDFMNETENHMRNMQKRMERMVTLAFEEADKVSLMFNMPEERLIKKEDLKRIKLK